MGPSEIDREPNSNILRGDWFIALWADSYDPEHAQLVYETIAEQSELTLSVVDKSCL